MGIATSVACAVHCAILPLVLTSLPVLGVNIVENMPFELSMIAVSILIGVYSLLHGFRKHHRSILPMTVFAAGAVLLIAKQVWHNNEYWFLGTAVVLIVSAHWMNYRACRKHAPTHYHDHQKIVNPR